MILKLNVKSLSKLNTRDPITKTYSDIYYVKFAPEHDAHSLEAEKLRF